MFMQLARKALRQKYRAGLLLASMLLVSLLGVQIPTMAQTWFNGYTYRQTITIDHAEVPNTDQTNFPVLISGTYPFLATTANGGNVTNANGYDIIFTSDSYGTQTLPFEIENYNPTTGAIVGWVQVPTVSHTSDTIFYMFYGNSSVTTNQSNKTGTWDANYAGVWHLANGAALSASDSTANGNNGTVTRATATEGQIDGAANLSGSQQYIDLGDNPSLQITGEELTVEAWINTSEASPSAYERLIVKETPGNGSPYVTYGMYRNPGNTTLDWCISSGATLNCAVTSNLPVNSWTQVVGTYDGSNLRVYVNGALNDTVAMTGNIGATTQDVVIGADTADGGEFFNGEVDEVRISDSVRSADWIATQYNNQSAPSAFYSIGAAASGGGTTSPGIVALSPSSGPTGIAVTISGGNFGSTQGTSSVTFGGVAATATSWSNNSITATVPANALTGDVVVTVSGVASNAVTYTVTSGPGIYSLSPSSGPAGTAVVIDGVNFGLSQGNSSVSYGSTTATVFSWSNSAITATVPANAVSDPFSVTVGGQTSNPASFTVTPLPTGWSQADIGSVGSAGSATYASGVFTIEGSGTGMTSGSSDEVHFVYQPLSGDGTIVARVVSVQGNNAQAGVMIRETLNANATDASVPYESPYGYFCDRPSTGSSTTNQGQSSSTEALPYWVKVVRSGNSFSGYVSFDGVNWTQLGSTQTITMATNAYIGLAVSSGSNSSVATAIFDNVSISSDSSPSPVITGLSATTASIGTVVAIYGSGFGGTEGSSVALLNDVPLPVSAWSDGAIIATIPSGASSGPMVVSVGPDMISSNPVEFEVTSQPLPAGWLDQNIGGPGGSATFSNGVLTVNGAGSSIGGTADSFHFVYQPLSGDGTIIARVVSYSGSSPSVGLMIRNTLDPGSSDAFIDYLPNTASFYTRSTAGGSSSVQNGGGISGPAPFWLELVRSGSTFAAYVSVDGVDWNQVGTSQTISMNESVYIGLAASPVGETVTFDNISVNSNANPAPSISGISPTTVPVGGQVAITGSNFGASQNGSAVTLNGEPVVVNSWSATSISVTVPAGATSGPLLVSVAPTMNDSNAAYLEVTSQPLPTSWYNQDIGSVGIGSATYANNVFTLNGAGAEIGGTADGLHFVYQPLSGDGTIIARVVSYQGSSGSPQAGVMIREALDPGAADAFVSYNPNTAYLDTRSSEGGNTSTQTSSDNGVSGPAPFWVELVRSGSTFTAYISPDGVNWSQVGSQTITMAQTVYIGLAVSPKGEAVTFDNVSVSSAAIPAPTISQISATTGSVGSQVTITGSNFGPTQGGSAVFLSDAPMTISSWSDTSITVTVPAGAITGDVVVSVAPALNDSNPVYFTVTGEPLPSGWLGQYIGAQAGSATYADGAFTVVGPNGYIGETADGCYFVYQQLTGDGSIIAQVTNVQGGSSTQAGVMMREGLDAGSPDAFVYFQPNQAYFEYRSSDGGSTSEQATSYPAPAYPYWVKLTLSGNTFSAYISPDGTYWTQVGTSQTIAMTESIYVGLAVAGTTASFENVSVVAGTPTPEPTVSSVSPTNAGWGDSVTINGSGFGATQGTSQAYFNGVPAASITSWSDSQIVAAVPNGAASGPATVVVNGVGSNSNVTIGIYHPVITSVTPPSAPVGGQITITGSGFGTGNGAGQVNLNGAAQDAYQWSDTSISVTLLSDATSGPLAVTLNGVPSNTVQFTVIGSPTISGISPSSGAVGSTVTISGSGFGSTQSDSYATFDGVTATVLSWSDSSITAVVPSDASTGPVTVDVAGIEGDGPPFSVTSALVLTDSLGNQTTYSSTMTGGTWYVASTQGSGCSTCTVRGDITNQYDDLGNELSTTDELGYATSYTYDSNEDVTSVTQPAVSGGTPTTTDTYNGFGEVLTTTDPLGHVTTNTYDSHGNLLTVTTPPPNGNTAASLTQFAYNSLGELTQITDPLGHVTAIAYTPQGYIASITDPQQNTTSYGYDSRGNRTSVTDAMGHVTNFTYDLGNRLTQITYPDNSTVSFGYDYRGRRTSATDQNGKTTTYAYDDADRLTSVTDPAGNVTQYGYDTESNLTSITDANGHTTNFSYDAYGRVTQTTFPSNYFETYQYDADNNLTSKTDRNGNTIQYLYDALNRLTQKNYPDSTSAEYTYDLVGKILQVNDPTGTYAFAYDNMGRLIGTTTTYSFLPNTPFTNSYTYDADSNRTGYTAPDGSTNAYTYDTLNRLTTLANSWAGSFGFSYDSLSRRTQMTRPNGISTNYAYDSLSRLLSVLHQAGGSTIDGAAYTLDAAGNRTAKTDELAGVTSNYTYDKIYELTQVMQGANTTESYSYDPVGNRLSSLGVPSYTVNSSNELTGTSNASYTYDQNGNTTSKTDSTGTTSYTWDFENRLTGVTLPGTGGTVTFKYDPFGRRIEKTSPTTTSIFAYDGYNVAETVNGSGSEVASYTQTQDVDETLAMERSSAIDYYEVDGNGSITSLSATNGSVAQSYTYDSFGNTTNSSGSLTNFFRYAGREFDTETNLYYNRARYLDPATGRFLSEEPKAYAGRTSLYAYVGNNPTAYTDPSGNTRIYGNWCGPDWTGGRVEEYNPTHIYLPPINNVDYVCMQHDMCYYSCRANHPCNSNDRQNCMRICDSALIRDEPNTTWGNIIRNGIKWFNKNPGPGTNAHCGCQEVVTWIF